MRTQALLALCLVSACHPVEQPPPLAVPAAPGQLFATSGPGFIRLVWSDQSDNEDQFVIGRVELVTAQDGFEAASLTELTRTTADQTVFRDPLGVGRFYAYGVAAVNAAGRSEWTLQPAPARGVISASTGAPCQVAVPSAEDLDGDGLPDEAEDLGWTVRVDQNGMGQFDDREVQSPSGSGDADGDSLCDGEERILRTDPNKPDTDGDGLSDADEVLTYGSSPINVDSDGDGLGNPAFFDGAELTRYGTSPTLADTDGDGRTDFEELNQNSTNPLLADLPAPRLELVGSVDISLNARLSNGTLVTDAVTQSLTQGTEQATNQTSSTATTVSSETSIEASATVSAGYPDGVSASVSATYGQTDGYMKETSTSFEQSSVQSAQQGYQAASSREISQQQTIEDGKLAVQFTITNAGTRTFELQNLVVTALTRDRDNPASFSSIASLDMPAAAASVTLGESQSAGPFRVEATISANKALDLLSNPSGISFRPASFQLIDRSGQNFAFTVGETTSNRTALLMIDYGGERPLESYRVATNVARDSRGKVAGVKMAKVLEDIVRLPRGAGFQTARNPAGVSKLTQVRDVAVKQRGSGTSKFWAVIAAENATSAIPAAERLLDAQKDFEDLLLMPGDRIYLAYEADEDGDGLYAREERLYRTSDTNPDSDGDGLSDRLEIRDGWNVFSTLPYYVNRPHVFSDPSRADADGDHLDDAQERTRGTDPGRADTDGDGLDDDLDPAPLVGLGASSARSFGTSSEDRLADLQVDGLGNLHLLAHAGGDFDGDGYLSPPSGGSLFFSVDRAGVQRWATDLEFPNPPTQNSLVLDRSNDHLFFLENLIAASPAMFPGVLVSALHLVELDRDGAVIGLHPMPGVTGFRPSQLHLLPDGNFITFGVSVSGPSPRIITFDASGNVLANFAWSSVVPLPAGPMATNTRGVALVRGCLLDLLAVPLQTTNSTLNFCGTVTAIDAIEWSEDGDFTVAQPSGAVSRFSAQGALRWTNNAPAGAGMAFRRFTLDSVGRTYVVTAGTSGGAVLRRIAAGGTVDFQITLPDHFSVAALRVDSGGNLFVGGHSTDGLNGTVRAFGNNDVVVIRNPQFLYP